MKALISILLTLYHASLVISSEEDKPKYSKRLQYSLSKFDRQQDIIMCVQMSRFIPFEEANDKITAALKGGKAELTAQELKLVEYY